MSEQRESSTGPEINLSPFASPFASRFTAAVALVSLLVTLAMADGAWRSLRPDPDAAGLAERRAYYEKVLLKADVSWREAAHYRALDGTGAAGARR